MSIWFPIVISVVSFFVALRADSRQSRPQLDACLRQYDGPKERASANWMVQFLEDPQQLVVRNTGQRTARCVRIASAVPLAGRMAHKSLQLTLKPEGRADIAPGAIKVYEIAVISPVRDQDGNVDDVDVQDLPSSVFIRLEWRSWWRTHGWDFEFSSPDLWLTTIDPCAK